MKRTQQNRNRLNLEVAGNRTETNDILNLARKTDSALLAEDQLSLARVWERQGKFDNARQKYEKTLWLLPDHIPAIHELGRLLITHQPDQAVGYFLEAISAHPNESVLHKGLADALEVQSEPDRAFEIYQLSRKDPRDIRLSGGDLLCCLVVRNETTRLPFFLSYYRQLGVDRFFVIDNDSQDETSAYLSDQDDVHLWHSPLSFNRANFGSAWFELLLRRYAHHNWCLIVDIDELFYYPKIEERNLPQLCRTLDREGKKAFEAVLLDMYADRSIDETNYQASEDFRSLCPYFDRKFHSRKIENGGPYKNQVIYFGGVRQRIFGPEGQWLLSKVPLIKYDPETVLAGGQHWTNCAVEEMAEESGCLLHFKFMSNFRDYVEREVDRKEHFQDGMQYREYARVLSAEPALLLYDPRHSVRLRDSGQLVELGIMRAEEDKAQQHRSEVSISFPEITTVVPMAHRPTWSVMITVYNRSGQLTRALESVLAQAPDISDMQIEVVSDSDETAVQSQIAAIVNDVGGSRVTHVQTPARLGHPEIFNECIRRAKGEWVHILHDDDWILPGFYAAMEKGLSSDSAPGAAFCRGIHINPANLKNWTSWLERDTAGIIANWLERIALDCRVQFSSVVVRRDVFERLGGFCAEARSVFDWDMWKRIAIDEPFWFEPEILARSSKDGNAESDFLVDTGRQISDCRNSIQFSHGMFPQHYDEALSNQANDALALRALAISRLQMNRGKHESALANLREGLKCSRSDSVTKALVRLLSNYQS